MKNAVLYCDIRSINDATIYYVEIIKEALAQRGYAMKIAHTLNSLQRADLIVAITAKYFVKAKFRFPLKQTIYWAQGISEEAKMLGRSRFVCVIKQAAEYFAVKNSTLLMVVSEGMREHFFKKYGYKKANYYIMPCFNKQLLSIANAKQFDNPYFVYAGSASVWQAVDEMLDSYAIIENNIEGAKLTILTNEYTAFEAKLKTKGIRNYDIKYVKLENLDEELEKHKYGFLLREEHVVNHVATPTKMNSYLACHLIPIFTTAVQDFNDNLDLAEYTIKLDTPINPKEVAEKILNFETKNLTVENYLKVVEKVFDKHYNRCRYVTCLSHQMAKLGI